MKEKRQKTTKKTQDNKLENFITLLPPDYDPLLDDDYMGIMMKEYFYQRLLQWRQQLLLGGHETIDDLKSEPSFHPDILDRASVEASRDINLRTRDRERKLIIKINNAIESLKSGTYGYCEETGVEIGVKRLIARPITSLSLKAQESHEKQEKKI